MEVLIGGVSVLAAVEAIMKLVKLYVSSVWLPLMNVVIALAVVSGGWYGGLIVGTLEEVVWGGIVIGLAAGGFYEVRKAAGVPF